MINARHLLLPLAAALTVSACGSSDEPTIGVASTTQAKPATTATPASMTTSTVATGEASSPTSLTSTMSGGLGTAFPVGGGALAAAVDEQVRTYGAVLTAEAFALEFGVHALPYPDALGVIVVDHQQLVSLHPPQGASRWDSVTYAFTDPRTADELVDAAADALGVDLTGGAGVAGCTEGTDPVTFMPAVIVCPADDGSWTMQLIRDTFVRQPPAPPVIVATHLANHAAVAALGAELSEWNLTRSPSKPDGNTLTITYVVPATFGLDDLAELYLDWAPVADQGYGPAITDGTNYWTLDTSAGRLTLSSRDLATIG